jgi:uncharacterized YigZ family protein
LHSYFTIQPVEDLLYKDKASKFIGFAYPVQDEHEIKIKLEELRKRHPKATHHCYAYRLGLDKHNFRCNNDGEPNGTAGKPILGQLDSFGITNCLLIIVRYFGGTKLGVSGLIEAYKACAKATLEATTITEQRILAYYELKSSYENINKIYQISHNNKAIITEQVLDNLSVFVVAIEQDATVQLEKKLMEEQIEFAFLENK